MDMEKEELKRLLRELEGIRGRHTELVSVYVPSGYNIQKVAEQIRSEQSTAQNIKSKTVRKNVTAALEKIAGHLKHYRKTPENGLVILCGNVSEKEGVSDIRLWAIEPPEPIRVRLYRCDQKFILDPLKELVREREVYGLIVLDKSEADIGLLKGKILVKLKHLDSIVPGKTKAGGWSQQRYARIREALLNDFLKKIGEIATHYFRDQPDLKGIIIGGPGPVKEQFAEEDYLAYDMKKQVLGVVNTAYTGEYGLRELVERAEEILREASVTRERRVLEKFFEELAKGEKVVYGLHETLQALRSGNVELLLLSEGFDWRLVKAKCECGWKGEVLVRKGEEPKCPECKKALKPESVLELEEKIIKLAEEVGTRVERISRETPKGQQFWELGGIGGILRFKI
ncbi:MAG: peptide chain release factor 1 [Candidatus Aenigmatarchaeota archaeon]|nr:MAG: peptide chain release factor 1 [Candidatus Aenigmarchaeota archaeon]